MLSSLRPSAAVAVFSHSDFQLLSNRSVAFLPEGSCSTSYGGLPTLIQVTGRTLKTWKHSQRRPNDFPSTSSHLVLLWCHETERHHWRRLCQSQSEWKMAMQMTEGEKRRWHSPVRLLQARAAAIPPALPPSEPPPKRPSWLNLLPQLLTYSTDMADIDPHQLRELWSKTLGVERDPNKIMTAMRNSISFVVVLVKEGSAVRTVGVGRAISDGAFIASICDVAVHPEYQRRGIGRKIVKRLAQDMRHKGPTGFAAFPPPLARRFFWMAGFRADKKYRLMAYRGTDHPSIERVKSPFTLPSREEVPNNTPST